MHVIAISSIYAHKASATCKVLMTEVCNNQPLYFFILQAFNIKKVKELLTTNVLREPVALRRISCFIIPLYAPSTFRHHPFYILCVDIYYLHFRRRFRSLIL